MKLNKWIFKKIKELDYLVDNTIPSEEDIEMWIIEWYESIYERQPPLWLTGKRWNDKKEV
tara:strand:- start:183 stop:362 length:180 start_codon:yes stop_codon:yes gene_type:complete